MDQQTRTRLTELQGIDRLWAASRASYILSVSDQQDRSEITQEQLRDYMYDVIRCIFDDAGAEDQELAQELRQLACTVGGITE